MTTNHYSDLPQRSGSFQAMVRAGDSVTAYLRTGKGPPVILLRRAEHADPLWGLVLGEVARAHRAILPERAPDGAGFGAWFRSFLDGLGFGAVRVAADAHFGVLCAESGVLEPDWLTALVVVSQPADYDAVARALGAIGDSRVPSCIVRADAGDPRAVAILTVQQLQSKP